MSQHSSISTFCALRHGKYQPHTHRLGNPTKGLSSYSLSASPQTLRFSPITRLPTLRGDVSNSATGCHSTHWYGTCTLRLNPVPIRLLHPFDIWSVSFLALLEPDHDTSNCESDLRYQHQSLAYFPTPVPFRGVGCIAEIHGDDRMPCLDSCALYSTFPSDIRHPPSSIPFSTCLLTCPCARLPHPSTGFQHTQHLQDDYQRVATLP